jgi:hypothetical protein
MINNTRSDHSKEQHRKIYTELNKEVKKMARADKKNYI